MTPRRVKRRSVMARGTNSRQSTTSRRSHGHGNSSSGGGGASGSGTHSRSSVRSSRRKYHQNPVTKILDQQQMHLQQQKQHHHHHQHSHQQQQPQQQQQHGKQPQQQFGSFHHKDNPTLTLTNLENLNQEIIGNSGSGGVDDSAINIIAPSGAGSVGVGSLTKANNNHYHSFRKNIPPDPIYYNVNGQAGLFQQCASWRQSSSQPSPIIVGDEPSPTTPTLSPALAGHYNPTYQHSTTNLNDNAEHADELYNNRPPSVRSSYSNFHGTRPLSSYLANSGAGTTENVFMGLTGAAQQQAQQSQHVPPSTPPLYQQHPLQHQHPHSASQTHLPLPSPNFPTTPPQNIPFAKRTASRESIRSMAFLNSGPPAYNLNYHTPPDSETTM